MEKLMRMARGLDVARKILFVLFVILAAAALVVLVVVFVIGGKIDSGTTLPEGFVLTLTTGDIALSPSDSIALLQAMLPVITLGLVIILAATCCWIYVLIESKRMLAPMMLADPFNGAVSRGFRRLGWFTIVYGIVGNIVALALRGFVSNTLSTVLATADAAVFEPATISIAFIFIALLLFLLSYVFRYGEDLQQLSDETL